MRPRKRGRPAHKPTPKSRRTVEEMRSCGDSQASIARALKVDEDTLRFHYAEEIANGHSARRREVVELLFKSARKGNVSAQKRLEQMTAMATPDAEEAKAGEIAKPATQPKPAKLGKKEAVRQGALTAGAENEWGDDLSPPAGALPN